jgi:uncharacterized protein YutE (UPF0331/DUF86 family)
VNEYRRRMLAARLTHDVEIALKSMTQHQNKLVHALEDRSTREELRQLTGDLRSLIEVIEDEKENG